MEATNETGKNPAGAQSSANGANLSGKLAAALDEADIAMATACCGYLPTNGGGYPVKWNPYNREVQCHNCGAIWMPKAANMI